MVQIPARARQYYLPKLEGIDSLTIRPFDVPKPHTNQVLVKIHAVSLNFRDIIISQDQYPPGCHANLVPCSDEAGEVVAVGEDVKKWKVGDRVSANFAVGLISGNTTPEAQETALGGNIDGTLTEYQVFPDYSLVRIPDYLSYEEASTLPCTGVTAWNALHGPVPVKAGDYVLLQGTGGVSIIALQIAVASGATVIVTSSSHEKLAQAKTLGAKHVINYKEIPVGIRRFSRLCTNGEGVDHVVEVGGPATFSKSLNSLRMGGWISIIGFLGGLQSPDDMPLPMQILFKDANVRGILVGSRTQFEDLNRALSEHKIKPVIDSVFGFDEAVIAYRRLESQKHLGKVVIRVASN